MEGAVGAEPGAKGDVEVEVAHRGIGILGVLLETSIAYGDHWSPEVSRKKWGGSRNFRESRGRTVTEFFEQG
jgi:hypothetical protein